MNADCIARSPVVTLQGHPALRSTIEKKPATIITRSFKKPIQERQQDTTIHSNTTSNLNHLQGEVHQLQEQLDRGDSEATTNTQVNYVKPISIAAGLVILRKRKTNKNMSTRERRRTKRHFPNTYESGENADDYGIIQKKNDPNH